MAVFASVLAFFCQCKMRRAFEVLGIDLVMAALAGVGADVGRARNRPWHFGGLLRRMLAGMGLLSGGLGGHIGRGLRDSVKVIACEREAQNDGEERRESNSDSSRKLGSPHKSLPGDIGL